VKTIIAGGRDITDFKLLILAMEAASWHMPKVTEVVSGGCRGVDKLGERWADDVAVPVKLFKADWSKGKRAGPMRNRRMASYGDNAVILWDGKSAGTRSMIDFMIELRKPVFVFIVPKEEKRAQKEDDQW
jgi:hypothetical protein